MNSVGRTIQKMITFISKLTVCRTLDKLSVKLAVHIAPI